MKYLREFCASGEALGAGEKVGGGTPLRVPLGCHKEVLQAGGGGA